MSEKNSVYAKELLKKLTLEEKEWLNGYHALVAEALADLLTEEENAWLRAKCAPIG